MIQKLEEYGYPHTGLINHKVLFFHSFLLPLRTQIRRAILKIINN